MKKALPIMLCATCLLLCTACEKDSLNTYGDYSVRSQLELLPEVVSIHGDSYPLVIARTVDTTFRYFRTEQDTIKNAEGKPLARQLTGCAYCCNSCL